jgi:hypothetical protein
LTASGAAAHPHFIRTAAAEANVIRTTLALA